MNNSEFKRIKKKILKIDHMRYWGDDFDVRFYLISILKELKKNKIIDIGGGIGIISSELNESNDRINLDLSFDDLKKCEKMDSDIQLICGSMMNLPFKDNSFDHAICSHVLEEAKSIDLKNNEVIKGDLVKKYPSIEKILSEVSRTVKKSGSLYLTTSNNAYYNSNKMEYDELKNHLEQFFEKFDLYFFNTFPHTSKKYRKFNLPNIIPKILSKIINRQKIINSLILKDQGIKKTSVTFFVKVVINEINLKDEK